MSEGNLETFANQLNSLDHERQRVALAAFQQLSESDRDLWEMAKEAFDSEEIAAGWLSEPVPALGDEIPLVLLVAGKREDVVFCLGKIRYGLFA